MQMIAINYTYHELKPTEASVGWLTVGSAFDTKERDVFSVKVLGYLGFYRYICVEVFKDSEIAIYQKCVIHDIIRWC